MNFVGSGTTVCSKPRMAVAASSRAAGRSIPSPGRGYSGTMRPPVIKMLPSYGGTAIAPTSQASNTSSSRASSIRSSTAISTGSYTVLFVSQSENRVKTGASRLTDRAWSTIDSSSMSSATVAGLNVKGVSFTMKRTVIDRSSVS